MLFYSQQGGSASGERALTAFVLIALKEAEVVPGVSTNLCLHVYSILHSKLKYLSFPQQFCLALFVLINPIISVVDRCPN